MLGVTRLHLKLEVVISPGGFATSPTGSRPWPARPSSLALEGSQHALHSRVSGMGAGRHQPWGARNTMPQGMASTPMSSSSALEGWQCGGQVRHHQ